MTIRKTLTKRLVDSGIWPKDALILVEKLVFDDKDGLMDGRWDDEVEDYGPGAKGILLGLWLTLAKLTLKWIDETQPQVWYRPVFAKITGEK